MRQSKQTAQLYKQATLKAFELGGDMFPQAECKLLFLFPSPEATTEFWKWFNELDHSKAVAKGWSSFIQSQVVISFSDFST